MDCPKCEEIGDFVEMDKEVYPCNNHPNVEETYFMCGRCGYECEDLKEVDEDDRLIE